MPTMTLLQFSVPDLSTIARGLDELEQSFTEGRRGRRSGNMDDTGVYPTAQRGLWALRVTRLLFITGTTESPGSLESLVGAAAKCLFSAADGTSIRRLRKQTCKLAKRRNERIHESSAVRFAFRSGGLFDGRVFYAAHSLRSSSIWTSIGSLSDGLAQHPRALMI